MVKVWSVVYLVWNKKLWDMFILYWDSLELVYILVWILDLGKKVGYGF